jgi:hypothetical protein
MPITIIKRNVNILSCAWRKPTGIESLFLIRDDAGYNLMRSADLLIYVDNKLVGVGKISESNTQVINFDINLNAVKSHFVIKTRVVNQQSILSSSSMSVLPVFSSDNTVQPIVISEEVLGVDISTEHVTCEVISKSAKINPTFVWDQTVEQGLDIASATEIITTWRQFKPFYWDDQFLLNIIIDEDGISNETINFETIMSDTLFTSCPCPKHHGEWTGVTRGTTPKCYLPAPTTVVIGTEGSTLYGYVIVPVLASGVFMNASPVGIVATGPAILNNVDYITITWDTVPGAAYYRIYRTRVGGTTSSVSVGLLGSVNAPTTTYNDVGLEALTSLSTLQNPTHTYYTPGTYTWEVTANLDGTDYVKSGTITIT